MSEKSAIPRNFLLEIGVEELPTDALAVVEAHFKPDLEKRLAAERLSYHKVEFYFTPRRLVLFIAGIGDRQKAETVEWLGPAWDKAYDAEGKPTPALAGFLKSKNLGEGDVSRKETPKGVYVAARKILEGKKTEEILPGIITELLKSLPFAKRMRWDETGYPFPRPARWIVSLLGSKVLRFSIGLVKSDAFTTGHRFLSPGKMKVRDADFAAFKRLMVKLNVTLNPEERKQSIRKQFRAKAGRADCDEELVELNANLTELPFVITGKFSKSFLSLPKEILSTCMKKNQKIFLLTDAQGRSKAEFAAVLNGRKNDLPKIVEDYRGVLEARLRDSEFFYAEDTKEPLEKKVPRLKDIIFLGKLGNIEEKIGRMAGLAEGLAKSLELSEEEKENLKRACFLCKADLLTQMVYEFPELQGIMGREYARVNGEKEEVARAIAEHYLPKQLAQSYEDLREEQTKSGALLAILDKIDTLVGAFGIGLEPTGSHDPYALRRAGGGIVKILRTFRYPLDLQELISQAIGLYGTRLTQPAEAIAKALERFFKERAVFELGIKAGSKEDEILKAVFGTAWSNISGVFLRYERLEKFFHKDKPAFEKARKVVERTNNILKGAKEEIPEIIDTSLFRFELEQRLYDALKQAEGRIPSLALEGKYEELTRSYGEILYAVLHEFFDEILVNAEEPELRKNRQALMKRVNRLYVDCAADLAFVSPVA